jgi:hypothetical protein
MKVAIMQPYFLPYLGYFQLMAKVDAFILYDDVNFINRGWINRNRINVNGKAHMLTMPLRKASQNRLICEICISADIDWRGRFLKSIQQAYARAPQFSRVFPLIEYIIQYPGQNLSDFLHHSLVVLRDHLKLKADIIATSRRYGNADLKAQARIIDICKRERASLYINSIGGLELYDHASFEATGLKLAFLNPVLRSHPAANESFIPGLSIVDLLMHNDSVSIDEQLHAGELLHRVLSFDHSEL